MGKQEYDAKGAQRGDFDSPGSTKFLSWMWKEQHSDMESWAVREETADVALGRQGQNRWLSLASSFLPPHNV